MPEGADRRRKPLSPEARARIAAANRRRAGRELSPEHRAKISAAQKGRELSPETRKKISAAKKGREHSPEHRAKLSAARRGRKFGPLSPEHRAKLSAANKGRKRSPEACARIGAASKGRKHSPEARARISAAGKGRKPGPETRAKIGAANRGRTKSPETRAKLSAARRGGRFVPRDLVDRVGPILDRHRAGRPESATSPATPPHTILLGEPLEPTYINGQAVKPLTPSQHAIVRVLLEAGDEGLTEREIRDNAGFGGGKTTLRRLKASHPLWAAIIVFPGIPHGRYRIAAVRSAG